LPLGRRGLAQGGFEPRAYRWMEVAQRHGVGWSRSGSRRKQPLPWMRRPVITTR
jgi:hypothetical protein